MHPLFNYIITIHNKEALIENVINSVIKCCGKNSKIYPVLDGCSDNSEKIIDKLIASNSQISIEKIILNDVHEIISINSALRISDQNVYGFNIILQDDVILQDENIEDQVIEVYNKIGPKLGFLSFRLGANINRNFEKKKNADFFIDYVENAYGHGIKNSKVLYPGEFIFRDIAIKSPVCIPTELIKNYGFLDENLSPCFHDDTEFSFRLQKNGYVNGVYAIKFQSDIEWGGTRDDKNKNVLYNQLILRNQNYVFKLYKDYLYSSQKILSSKIIIQKYYNQENLVLAKNKYKINKNNRLKFEKNRNLFSSLIKSFKVLLFKIFKS